jgi:hypothetical protein
MHPSDPDCEMKILGHPVYVVWAMRGAVLSRRLDFRLELLQAASKASEMRLAKALYGTSQIKSIPEIAVMLKLTEEEVTALVEEGRTLVENGDKAQAGAALSDETASRVDEAEVAASCAGSAAMHPDKNAVCADQAVLHPSKAVSCAQAGGTTRKRKHSETSTAVSADSRCLVHCSK